MRKVSKNILIGVFSVTVIYLLILALQPADFFFGVPGQWTWPGRPPSPVTIPRWWPGIFAIGVQVMVIILLDHRWAKVHVWHRIVALGFLAGMVPLVQILFQYVHYPYPFASFLRRVIGPHNGFWQAAISIDSIAQYVSTYPEQMRATRDTFVHLPTHPPGNIIYIWLWRKFFESAPSIAHVFAHGLRKFNCADLSFVPLNDAQIAAAVGQFSVPLFSGLTVIPLYGWGKQIRGRRVGWRTAALFSLTPALTLFHMRWDTVYPLFTALAFVTLHRGLVTRRHAWWFASGLTVSLASFCSFGNATLSVAVALYAITYLWLNRRGGIIATWHYWLALLMGGYAVWGLFRLITGVSVWEIFHTSIETHLYIGRTYWPWVVLNIHDLLLFTGVPVGTLFVIQALSTGQKLLRRDADVSILPTLTVTAVVLLLSGAGVVRGEVGRLWLLWMPVTALTAAVCLDQLNVRWGYALVVILMAVQAFWMTLFLRVTHTGMPSYHPQAPQSLTAPVENRLDVTFDENIHLIGYNTQLTESTQTLEVTLFWRAARTPDLPYTVFVHLVDPSGTLQAQHDSMPVSDELPTSCWTPDEIVQDVHVLTLPSDIPKGRYTLRVGMYYYPTLERLPITAGAGGDFVTLPYEIGQ